MKVESDPEGWGEGFAKSGSRKNSRGLRRFAPSSGLPECRWTPLELGDLFVGRHARTDPLRSVSLLTP